MSVTRSNLLSTGTETSTASLREVVAGITMRSDDSRYIRRFVMTAPMGFHVRPAALFARTAMLYEASVMIAKEDGNFVNGKGILGLLTLGVRCGEEVVVTTRGSDAGDAIAAIARLFAEAFGLRNGTEASRGDEISITVVPDLSRRDPVPVCA